MIFTEMTTMAELCIGKKLDFQFLKVFSPFCLILFYNLILQRYVVRPEGYVMPPPNTFLEGEEKLKKQSVDMLNMAQVKNKVQINLNY